MLNPECVVVSTFPHHAQFAETVKVNLSPIEQRPGIRDDQRPRIVAGTAPKDGGKWMTALGAAASAIEHQRSHIRAAVATVTA